MLRSKKIYNNLINKDTTFLFEKQYFYIIEDSLSFILNRNLYLKNISKKLVQKFIFKKSLISNFTNSNILKFPIYIVFFKEKLFFDGLFLNFFFKNLKIIFFKYKHLLLNLTKTEYESVLNLTIRKQKIKKLKAYLNKIIAYNFIFRKKYF
jgi:hypothetical protein